MCVSCVIPMEVKKLVRVHGGERREIEYRCIIKGGKCSNGTVKIKWRTQGRGGNRGRDN